MTVEYMGVLSALDKFLGWAHNVPTKHYRDRPRTLQISLIRAHIMIHNLDVNPTNRIPHKRTIVPGMILRPRTRRTVVFAASFDSSFIEFVYKLVVCKYH
jgi:hypothetical protein